MWSQSDDICLDQRVKFWVSAYERNFQGNVASLNIGKIEIFGTTNEVHFVDSLRYQHFTFRYWPNRLLCRIKVEKEKLEPRLVCGMPMADHTNCGTSNT